MDILFTSLLTVMTAIVSGLILFLLQRFFVQQHQRDKDRDSIKAKEYSLILRSLEGLGRLTVANSIALRDGKINGEMTEALKEYAKIEKEMHDHLINVHAEEQKG